MAAREEEVELAGGSLSRVVRVGDTVRRPAGPWTPAVHALLDHLAARGFDGAPRARGIDELGREILDYLPGDTVGGGKPWPAWSYADETLDALGRLLRRFHDAVADFVLPDGMAFRLESHAPGPGEIICHNDVGPYNVVRQPDGSLALIDWDVAGPAHPLDDLAFAARTFAPLHPDASCREYGFTDLDARPERLRRLLDAYGLETRNGFLDRVEARSRASIARITEAADRGEAAFVRLIATGGLEPVHESIAWVRANREALERALD